MKELPTWFHTSCLMTNTKKPIAAAFHTWQNKSFLKLQMRSNNMYIKYKYETQLLSLHPTEDIK